MSITAKNFNDDFKGHFRICIRSAGSAFCTAALIVVILVSACGDYQKINTDNPTYSQEQRIGTSIGRKSASVIGDAQEGDWGFYRGDFSKQAVIGMSLPGSWRPYDPSSPWNTKISSDAQIHSNSVQMIQRMYEEAQHLRFVKKYNSPIWIVNSQNIAGMKVKSDKIYDFWDQDSNGWSDSPVPLLTEMWAEPTEDGHIIIIDPFKMLAWEMSRFKWTENESVLMPTATTLNIWDLKGSGYAQPAQGKHWKQRGGRGSGTPVLAGIIRPEELKAGVIKHALMFNFSQNRKYSAKTEIFISPPAARSDGKYIGDQYPIEGMRLQLNPQLGESDFNSWGLTKEGKVIARALQEYGMILVDNGGAMSLGIQLLAKTESDNKKAWEDQFPGLFKTLTTIPTNQFRVLATGQEFIR